MACHVIEHLERIGASGVIIEDQQRPRRCGHVEGKRILPLGDYLEKLQMVLETRRDLVVVARTDANEEGEIVRRAEALAATDLDELGVSAAIYSTPCLFAAQRAMDEALARLTEDDGRLPPMRDGAVGVAGCLQLLGCNLSRHHDKDPT